MSVRRNLGTPEWRAFWACAEEASKRVEQWPTWKVSRHVQGMTEAAPASIAQPKPALRLVHGHG